MDHSGRKTEELVNETDFAWRASLWQDAVAASLCRRSLTAQSNHPPSKHFEDHSQIQPTLVCPHVRDICVPFLVRALGREVLLKQG
jgi:hypothetical protein